MGCDIHAYAERRGEDGNWELIQEVFDGRSYSVFAFLAGVRNYSGIVPISEPRGIPDDISSGVRAKLEPWEGDVHSKSWLSMQELLQFDYSQMMEDRRVTRNNNGGCTCEPGEGQVMTYGEYLGKYFLTELYEWRVMGAERIVFWFDN